MSAVLAATAAALGAFYLYTALVLRWRGLGIGPSEDRRRQRRRRLGRKVRDWLVQAGLDEVGPGEFLGVAGALFVIGALFGILLFGGALPGIVLGTFAAAIPVASARMRRRARIEQAQEAWPRLIEQIRVLTGSVGRSIPQALLEVGGRGPVELRPAFAAAQREWQLSTDFARTLDVLTARLADPTADATGETLLVAHELGGSDLDARLAALADDRRLDTRDRKDARAHQSGARFARRFVLIVPLGMALAGMSVGNGRDAYATPGGQITVVVALLLVLACWIWAGRIMRLPTVERVFRR
jgi:tight adherence protein B